MVEEILLRWEIPLEKVNSWLINIILKKLITVILGI